MLTQRFVIFCYLCLILTGCTGLDEKQPPAPVIGGHRGSIRSAPAQTQTVPLNLPSQTTPPVVSTKPLEHFNQELSPIEIAPDAPFQMPIVPEDSGQEPATSEGTPELPSSSTQDLPAQQNMITVPETKAPEPEVFSLTPFQPIEPPVSSSPAVGALVIAANQSSQSGNVEVAATSIDRALKIEPRNPSLYYKLALIRLKQSKPQEAENLAKKSALLAGRDRQLKKHSWLLIAHARELRRDFKGARQARAKADSF